MPEIGTQLRDARTEAGIDIATAEYATKIRSKYLRALESGDWAALPEETAAKSFLRTYADYLGLDGRELVEVFKAGQPAASPAITSSFNGADSASSKLGKWRIWLVVALVVLLIVGLFLIGSSSNAAELTTAAAGGAVLQL